MEAPQDDAEEIEAPVPLNDDARSDPVMKIDEDVEKASSDAGPHPSGPTLPVTVDLTGIHLAAHPWDRYVRGFRHEHNFALSLGGSSGAWVVQHFGVLQNQTFHSGAAWAKFQYSYHLQIYKGFGYMLGSSTGYFYESVNRERAYQPVPAVMFPGVLAGFVMNFTPSIRLSTALDVYMERMNNVVSYDSADRSQTEKISITMVAYDLGGFLDLFYDLDWAVRLEVHDRLVYYYSPLQQPGDTTHYASDALFHLADRWYGVGIVFHLL